MGYKQKSWAHMTDVGLFKFGGGCGYGNNNHHYRVGWFHCYRQMLVVAVAILAMAGVGYCHH